MKIKEKIFFKNILVKKKKKEKIFKTSLIILPSYENLIFDVYNGKTFIKLKILKEMIGYKFGEFINTRKRNIYKKK